MNDRSYASRPRDGEWYLEDFEVGQSWQTKERTITAADVSDFARLSGDVHPLHTDVTYAAGTPFGQPIAHGPFGIALTMGLLHDLHLIDQTIVALLDTGWTYRRPLVPGDVVHTELLITGTRRTSAGDTGVIDRDVRLVRRDGTLLQEGTLPCLVRARGEGPDQPHRAFGTVGWAHLLVDVLSADSAFATATATWDGSVGLQCGDRAIELRIYRGRILDATRRTPHGATFTLQGSPRAWTELALGPHNDLIRRSGRGEFSMAGDAYEYLRLTKALHLIVDAVRDLAGKEQA